MKRIFAMVLIFSMLAYMTGCRYFPEDVYTPSSDPFASTDASSEINTPATERTLPLTICQRGSDYVHFTPVADTVATKAVVGEKLASFWFFPNEMSRGTQSVDYHKVWRTFSAEHPDKIGICLSFKIDGKQVKEYICRPESAREDLWEYIEVYLYDDIVHDSSTSYSHLTRSTFSDSTTVSSVKLVAGKHISEVSDLKLTAFLYHDNSDFDANGVYIGGNTATVYLNVRP